MTGIVGLAATVTCPRCAGPLDYTASSRPRTHEARAVMTCPHCARRYVAVLTLLEDR